MVRIFWTIKTPDERATMKQACRDESIVSVFFPPIATYIALYFYVLSTVKRKNQYTDFLYIYIFIHIYLKMLNSVNLTPPLFKGCKRHDLRC